MVVNRTEIIDNLMEEFIEKILNLDKNMTEISNYKNDLRKFSEYFTNEEIEEYKNIIENFEYIYISNINNDWIKENIEILIFFLSDIKRFLLKLKVKKKDLLINLFMECIKSLKSYNNFKKFVAISEYYFDSYRHYFSEEEIKQYNNLWFELEIENATIICNNEVQEEKKWERNKILILEKIKKMLLFLDSI